MKVGTPIRTAALQIVLFIGLLLACGSAQAQLLGGQIATMPGPAPGEEFTELSSGIFTYSKTDLSLPGPMPINITRVYRSSDVNGATWITAGRDFGIGTRLNYDIFLYSFSEVENGQFADAEVVMPDGGMIKCIRSDSHPSTDYVDAQFACNQQPTGVWFGSTIKYNSTNIGWDLVRADGTTYHFGYNSPLQTITDRYNNEITISYGGTEVSPCPSPHQLSSSLISSISSSNHRSVSFCYDGALSTGISLAYDNASPTIKEVSYVYNSNGTLRTATQSAYNAEAITTYYYDQENTTTDTYPGTGDLTEIVTNDQCSGTNCSTLGKFYTYIYYATNALGTVVSSISSQLPASGYDYSYDSIPSGWTSAQQVTVTLPDNSKRAFIYDQAGYVTNDQRNVGVSGTNAEYTVFTRDTQTIGTVGNAAGTTEFVGEVQEQDQNQNTVRQTKYNYDENGNVLSMIVSPEPGAPDNVNTDCCSTSATWNYTYTTFDRVETAVEPLAFNGTGTTYSYTDTPSAPAMAITDPLGRTTTAKYNPQGQLISVTDPIGNISRTTYFSPSGDVQSETDASGNTTTYQTDPDGRVKNVTSPLNEVTTYNYDQLDDVTDVYVDPGHFNLHTNYTYDLIGEIASVTTPNDNMTTYTRTASLNKVTVKDPRGYTTITNIDTQGGATSYTDERGDVTSYEYDAFGRISVVGFNGAFDVVVGINDTDGAYDALDRPESVYLETGEVYTWPTFTYDSLDSVRSETGYQTGVNTPLYSLTYQYDTNGRRISLLPALNGVNQPTINYGYDCADELVSMSNNGTSLQSCGPGNNVTNGDPSTQVDIYYESDGNPWWTIVDGVLTIFTRDPDERVLEQDFSSYTSGFGYGSLFYLYDADGRVIDESSYLLQTPVTLPPADSATYSLTDQLSAWNGNPTNPDKANNIINDPVLTLTYTWNARNQLSAISGGAAETYDAFGRRVASSSATNSLSLIHDGASIIGSSDTTSGSTNTWTFLPGALDGWLTSGGITTTWVPLFDAAGSTIALVNAANTGVPPATTFTYDLSGVSTVSGASNSFPFLYQGLEHEVTDPGQLYFEPSGNVYNPQIQRELSLIGQQGITGSGFGGFGNFGAHGGSPGGPSLSTTFSDLWTVGTAFSSAESLGSPYGFLSFGGSENPLNIPIALIGNLLSLFGIGGGEQAKPYQLDHAKNQNWKIVRVADGLTPDQRSAAQGSTDPITLTGNASWYNPVPSGKSACKDLGYPYTDPNGFTAAMRNSGAKGRFPCGSMADVTYRPIGSNVPRTITVKIIDSGPYREGRVIDLSPSAFKALAGPDAHKGVIPVTVRFPAGPKPPLTE